MLEELEESIDIMFSHNVHKLNISEFFEVTLKLYSNFDVQLILPAIGPRNC
jgi:hypothetical protein